MNTRSQTNTVLDQCLYGSLLSLLPHLQHLPHWLSRDAPQHRDLVMCHCFLLYLALTSKEMPLLQSLNPHTTNSSSRQLPVSFTFIFFYILHRTSPTYVGVPLLWCDVKRFSLSLFAEAQRVKGKDHLYTYSGILIYHGSEKVRKPMIVCKAAGKDGVWIIYGRQSLWTYGWRINTQHLTCVLLYIHVQHTEG